MKADTVGLKLSSRVVGKDDGDGDGSAITHGLRLLGRVQVHQLEELVRGLEADRMVGLVHLVLGIEGLASTKHGLLDIARLDEAEVDQLIQPREDEPGCQ